MRVKLAVAVMTVATLLLGVVPGGPTTAAALTTGYHASFYSQSPYLTLAPGMAGQFTVGYLNTGDQPWVKGLANSQANLGTNNPQDNVLDAALGWSSGWLALNRYAAQSQPLVAPGQVGNFTYNVIVPANAPRGVHKFNGSPVIDGVVWMEDYGYFHVVDVEGSARVTSTEPLSPSAVAIPVAVGTGAAAGELVSILDGTGGAIVGGGSADKSGNFRIAVGTALASGSHQLVVSTPSQGTGVGFTYVIDPNQPPQVLSATSPSLSTVTVNFSKAMKCGNSTQAGDIGAATSYFVNVQPADFSIRLSSSSPSSDCKSTTLSTSTSLVSGSTYVVKAFFLQDASGLSILNPGTATFVAGPDTTAPTLTWATGFSGVRNPSIVVTFSKNMTISSGSAGSGSVTNPFNYQLDSLALPTGSTASCQSANCNIVGITLPSTTTLAVSSVHTVTVTSVQDYTGSNTINPNPSTFTFTTQ